MVALDRCRAALNYKVVVDRAVEGFDLGLRDLEGFCFLGRAPTQLEQKWTSLIFLRGRSRDTSLCDKHGRVPLMDENFLTRFYMINYAGMYSVGMERRRAVTAFLSLSPSFAFLQQAFVNDNHQPRGSKEQVRQRNPCESPALRLALQPLSGPVASLTTHSKLQYPRVPQVYQEQYENGSAQRTDATSYTRVNSLPLDH